MTVENQTDTVQKFTAYGAIPVYGRSADNIRDHRNVTSMLHRIETTEHGITSAPPCHLTSGDISQIIKSIM